jgi:large subunit ribosomal protein L13e
MIPNVHLHKDWKERVKTWFNQPARKERRRKNRVIKARKVAPRPVAGLLRPVVRCPSSRYNMRTRGGRGFSIDELKGAGVSKKVARSIGIAVDHRRQNHSLESQQVNVQRLKEYRSRLILFPKKLSKPHKGDSTADECKLASQLSGFIMPIKQAPKREKAQKITEDMKKFSPYKVMRRARADLRLMGYRKKKAAEAADTGIGKTGK